MRANALRTGAKCDLRERCLDHGQDAFRVYPESPTLFFYREVEAEIEFKLDPATQRATTLTLFQNGNKIRLERSR